MSFASGAAPSFTVSSNSQELAAKLNRMAGEIADPRGLLENIRTVLRQAEEEVFATEGSALGWAWNSLVQPERKVGGQMLVQSGAMKDSVTGFSAGTIRGSTLRIHPKPYYSRWHQFGTHTMDARPFTGISEGTARRIYQEFERATGEVFT
jgi:phage gpG-like protein